MTGTEWDDRYSTGIDAIDSDHRKLIELIDQLHQAMILGQTRGELPAIVGDLVDYAHRHFQFEESLMERHQYPGTEQHRQLHAYFTRMVEEFRASLQQGNFAISTSLFVMLQNWLIEHIMKADCEVAGHILGPSAAPANPPAMP